MEHTEVSSDVKKPDRRVIKTKRAIRNAFAALIAEKDLNDITIKDISDVADINRKTVYNYYGGIHEILDEIENELVSSFEKVIQEIDFPRNLENPNKIFETLTDVINGDMEFYSQLMKIDANSHLVRKIVSALKIRVKQTLAQQLPADKKKSNSSPTLLRRECCPPTKAGLIRGGNSRLRNFPKRSASSCFRASTD